MDDGALAHALPGAWKLLRWEISYSDGRPSSFPYGEQAAGLLLYTPDGHMSAGISRAQRPRFDAASTRQVPPEQKCAAFDGYFHYQGRYRVAEGCVVHEVTQSLNPDFAGSSQVRKAELHGDSLLLSAEDELPGTHVVRTHRLHWQRTARSD
jgi:Lipocalin-like domain